MSTIDTNKKIQKTRTLKEIRKALSNFIHRKHIMCIPPQVDDDDIVLMDAIQELCDAREKTQKILEIGKEALNAPEVVNSEKPWTAILEIALEDIVKICEKD